MSFSKAAPRAAILTALVVSVAYVPRARAETPNGAKNVILMIADGAGFNAFRAGAFYQYGDDDELPQSEFPVHVAVTTFSLGDAAKASADREIPRGYKADFVWRQFNNCQKATPPAATTDSAAAGTALHTGVKTTNGRVNVASDGRTRLETIAEIAERLGKSTGAVSSVQVSHATPASVAAHSPTRNDYVGIFKEMLYESGLEVIFGAGHPDLEAEKPEYKYVGGEATWRDMTDQDGANGYTFIKEKAEFERLASGDGELPTRVVGIAKAAKSLNEKLPPLGSADEADVPTLATLSIAALNVLNRDPDGFFVMIEGGEVDWAGHANHMERLLREQRDFNNAVTRVIAWVEENSSWDETLLIITADHETGQLWGEDAYEDANDDRRFDPKTEICAGFVQIQNRGQGVVPGHQFASGSHTNSLIPLWAIGSGSEAFLETIDGRDVRAASIWGFSGDYIDNTDVFRVMRSAMGDM